MEVYNRAKIKPSFTLDGFTFYYPEQSSPVLNNVSITVEKGAFFVLCGPSGCGKSTLLRQLKTVLTPYGHHLGEIYFEGIPLADIDFATQSQKIGFVQQSPENQVVTDKVWHELAFGLESLGYDTPTIRRRVAEMASFFGIENWFHQDVTSLSGGQKQLLNLASVMAMHPSVLILDEPTSQLDPIAAADFIATLGKLNRELGTTIILTEHRLEQVFPLATQVCVMDGGELIATGTPRDVGQTLKHSGHGMSLAMPTPMRIWDAVETEQTCPITIAEGREWLDQFAQTTALQPLPTEVLHPHDEALVIDAKELWFRYEKNSPDVVKGLNLQVHRGEFLALLGGNGTGKTTTLKLLAGLTSPQRGMVSIQGTIGVLPQNPQALFVKKTVREDLYEVFEGATLSHDAIETRIVRMVHLCHLNHLLDRHPYDLSGGEQQRVALCKVLLLHPDVLLLDEPTKGFDAEFKQEFAQLLAILTAQNITIVMISHDVEFCAQYAHRCALFFDGNIVTEDTPRRFFSSNHFYTTAASRMSRTILPDAITADDVIVACGGRVPAPVVLSENDSPLPLPQITDTPTQENALPLWRKLIAICAALSSILLIMRAISVIDLSALLSSSGVSASGMGNLWESALLVLSLLIFTIALAQRSSAPIVPIHKAEHSHALSKRTILATIIIILLIPLTLYIGIHHLHGQKYYFIALLILFECMAPFLLIFEGRKPQARELVVIAVLCAIAVAGRAALFMLPQFKPVTALCIISGVAFGGEVGFLVGAMTMLTSNILLGQGPWTPWQMFAMGIIGFLAGVLFRKGLLRRSRISLCTFGALACIIIYGGIMNPTFALLSSTEFNLQVILGFLISGLPMDLVHAAATVFFLWYGAEPMLEKLDRIKIKYGLMSR